MTYCIGLNLEEGLLFASDSRTNAGVDDVRRAGKMRVFAIDGDRVIVTLSAGNLSVTQNALNLLEHRANHGDGVGLYKAQSMFEVATLVGDAMREIRKRDEPYLRDRGIDASASFIVGGQVKGEPPRLFLVYLEGNFIESNPDTPWFQIGEIKFGKPILDRVVTPQSSLEEATKCALVSFDSTMRSNLSVGPPIDLLLYRRDSLQVSQRLRLEDDDAYLNQVRAHWNDSLRNALQTLPSPAWLPAGPA
ncbi:peptidase [Luteimonas aestuarii]|uniref:Peptidase n=1 Tax=Luteimonas aestuarii TaxID=453837 RepID=A0A4R5U192_9GAMM|nr:peptidase [Luteimonas aestuarii]TDK27360.1 peptidase [Luteimonas aestuarii]